MTALIQQVVLALVLTGVLAGTAVALTTGRLNAAVGILLEFLLAAGLLGLAVVDTWAAIGSVAVIVALRRLLVAGLGADPRHGHRSRDRSASAS